MTLPFDRTEFQVGVGAGLALATVLLLLGRAAARRVGAGLLWTTAALIGISMAIERTPRWPGGPGRLPPGLVVAVAVAAVAGAARDAGRLARAASPLLALAAGWIVATTGDLADRDWMRATVVVAVPIVGWFVAAFDKRWGRTGLPPAMLAISLVGLYYTLPDVEPILVVLGAGALLLVAGARRIPLGSFGWFACTTLVAWTVISGGQARTSAVIGGLGCLAPFVAEPIAAWIAREGAPVRRLGAPIVLTILAAHTGFVFGASRVVGTSPTGWRGPLAGLLLLTIATVVGLTPLHKAAGARAPRRHRARRSPAGRKR